MCFISSLLQIFCSRIFQAMSTNSAARMSQILQSPLWLLILHLHVLVFAAAGSQLLFKSSSTTSTRNINILSPDDSIRSTIPSSAELYFQDGITHDARTGQIYWASWGSIYRQRLDGTGEEIIVNSTVRSSVYGLAYDWVGDNIYYTKYDLYGYIGVCSLQSRACSTVIDNVQYPVQIALHPHTRTLYWTTGEFDSVYKASMDGSSPRNITEPFLGFKSITIDHLASRLYWTSSYGTFESSDLDGTNRVTVLNEPSRSFYGVAVHGDLLYWVEGSTRIKADSKLNASTSVVPLFNGSYIYDIQIPSPDNQPPLTTENPCEGHPCSHICVLSTASYRCLCPSGFRLGPDSKTCKDLDAKIVYWSESGNTVEIQTLSLNSSVRTVIPFTQGGRPGGLSHNPETAQIYWSFNYKNTIYRMEIDGTGKKVVFTTGGVSVRGIAPDWNASNIYYTDNVLSNIGVCSLNTGSCSILLKDGTNEPTDIAVYPSLSKIFWTDSGSKSIMRAYMNGSSPAVLLSANGQPYALSIDQESGLLFWVDSLSYEIRSLYASRESEYIPVRLLSGVVPLGIDARRGRVYWTEHYYSGNKTSAIKWLSTYDYSYVNRLLDSGSGEIWSNLQVVAWNG